MASRRGVPDGSFWRRVRLGRIWIDSLRLHEAVDAIDALVASRRGGCVFTPNVDHVVNAERDAALRAAYDAADLSLADGQPLVWSSHLLRTPLPERVSGSDLVWPLMERAARERWRVYLLGGAPGVAATAAARLARELGVEVAGVSSPAIALDDPLADDGAHAQRVRSSGADVVLVALGSPKQERWIHRHLEALRPTVALGIGASLDFISGRARRAPSWVSSLGMEWAFRLAREPRRLAYRYLIRDPSIVPILVRTALIPRAERLRPARA